MRYTIFDTPLLRTVLHYFCRYGLKLTGWKVIGTVPVEKKLVIIGAPHTSNWDMLMMMSVVFNFRLKVYWLGKKSLFKRPFGTVMKWFGGIPVEREKKNNTVSSIVERFSREDEMLLTISPEGTRSSVKEWRSGFYYIARGAGVPVLLGFIDHVKKRCGLGPIFHPTGNAEKDISQMKKFYEGFKGGSV